MDENKNKQVLEAIHLEIHALRLISGYKPSIFEFKVSKMIAERFAFKCKECKDKLEQYKTVKQVEKKPGIMGRLNHALEDTEQ